MCCHVPYAFVSVYARVSATVLTSASSFKSLSLSLSIAHSASVSQRTSPPVCRPPHCLMFPRISWLLPRIRCEAACRHFVCMHIVECDSKCLGLFLCLCFSQGIDKCLASSFLSLSSSVPAAASSRECPSVSTSAFESTSSGVSPVVCVPIVSAGVWALVAASASSSPSTTLSCQLPYWPVPWPLHRKVCFVLCLCLRVV